MGIEVVSEMGTQFKVNSSGSTPAQLTLTLKPNGIVFEGNESIEWLHSNDFENWSTEKLVQNSISQNLTYESFKQINKNDTCFIEAKITKNGKTYSDYITINAVRNGEKGEKGEDPITLVIRSSNGGFFRNNTGTTTLTAVLYQKGQEIDKDEPYIFEYLWYDINSPDMILSNSKTIQVTAEDVSFSRTYACDVKKKED